LSGSGRLAADATAALERLGTEEQSLLQEARAAETNGASVAERVAKAEATLSVSERAFDELTGTIADLTARRHAFEKALAEHSNRLDRLTGEAAAVEAERQQLEGAERVDLTGLAQAAEAAQAALTEAEAAALRAEAAHSAARQDLDVTRIPAGRGGAPGTPAGYRSQDARQASACRYQESLACP